MSESVGRGIPGCCFVQVGVGAYPDMAVLRQEIVSSSMGITSVAEMILDRIKVDPTEKEVLLWEVSGKELGQKLPAEQPEIFGLAYQCGFREASAEAIARSRVAYPGQGWRNGGMSPVQIGNNLCLLDLRWTSLRHWLGAVVMDDGYLFSPDSVWIFERSLSS